MPGKRGERLNEQVKREVAEILQTEVKDPRVGPVTVTGAKVAPDLSIAIIYVAPGGAEAEKKESLQGLNTAAPFVRTLLGQRLRVRKVPQLRFERDTAIEYATRIEQLLHEVRASEQRQSESDEA